MAAPAQGPPPPVGASPAPSGPHRYEGLRGILALLTLAAACLLLVLSFSQPPGADPFAALAVFTVGLPFVLRPFGLRRLGAPERGRRLAAAPSILCAAIVMVWAGGAVFFGLTAPASSATPTLPGLLFGAGLLVAVAWVYAREAADALAGMTNIMREATLTLGFLLGLGGYALFLFARTLFCC